MTATEMKSIAVRNNSGGGGGGVKKFLQNMLRNLQKQRWKGRDKTKLKKNGNNNNDKREGNIC